MIENILMKAIDKINQRHYQIVNPRTRLINEVVFDLNYSKLKTEPENNFVTYLLAHYLTQLDEINTIEEEAIKIFPQIQLYKRIVRKVENENLINDFKLCDGFYPDLVFHAGQDDNNPDNQKIVVECKINRNLKYYAFAYDFAKLYLCTNEINFQKAIFIIVNNDEHNIENYINKFKEKYQLDFSKIEIWIKNYGDDILIKNCR